MVPSTCSERRVPRRTRILTASALMPRACYELGWKSHRNADSTGGLVPLRSPFPAFLSSF